MLGGSSSLRANAAPTVALLVASAFAALFLDACSGCGGSHPLGRVDDAATDAPDAPAAVDGPPSGASPGDAPDAERDAPRLDANADTRATADVADAPDAAADRLASGSGDARTDANAAYLDAVSTFCAEKARRSCAWQTRCNRAFAAEADCRPVESARCEAALTSWQAEGADQGRVAFDATKVAACFAAFDNPECGIDPETSCAAPTRGRLPDGAPCVHAKECLGGTCGWMKACTGTCRSPGQPGDPCYVNGAPDCDDATAWCEYPSHVCRPKKALGDTCAPGNQCAPGTYCESAMENVCGDFADDDSACHCRAPRPAGTKCHADVNCQADLACIAGTCRALGKKGDVCDTGYLVGCVDDLACLPLGTGDDTRGVCADRVANGNKCLGNECVRGSKCEAPGAPDSGRCRPLHPLGAACEAVDDCIVGAYCRSGDFTCQLLPKLGESCAMIGRCWGGGGVTCVEAGPDAAICGFPPRIGEPCRTQCADGAYCVAGACVAKKTDFELCVDSRECRSAMCLTQPETPADCHLASCQIKRCGPYCE